MALQALLAYALNEDSKATSPSDEEKGTGSSDTPDGPQQETSHTDSGTGEVSERRSGEIHADADDSDDDGSEVDQDDAPTHGYPRLSRRLSSSTATLAPQPAPGMLSRIRAFIFPTPNAEEELESYIPNYRYTPIISGVIIPFSILLEIPGLTEHWYIRTDGSTVVDTKPNSVILDVGLALSITCAVLANACLIMRFLEKRVKTMTILCTIFLSIHDIINITTVSIFGIEHRYDDGFTYGESFWMTVCSTIASSVTNVTLIIDLVRTPDFERSGSGLTRRQRSLVIIIIFLFCYIALGALVNSLLLGLSFINGLYFTVVSIETIGFGDIIPDDTASRVFVCIYSTLGIVNLAVVVGLFRETVLEGLDIGYQKRIKVVQEKRRNARRRKRAENRWRHAIVWRLRARKAPIWIPDKKKADLKTLWAKLTFRMWRAASDIRSTAAGATDLSRGRHGMKLNLKALSHSQLEAAALEAGVPLDTLLPPGFYEPSDHDSSQPGDEDTRPMSSWFVTHPVYHRGDDYVPEPLTYGRVGSMAAMLTKFALAVFESGGVGDQLGHFPGVEDGTTTGDTLAPSSSGTLSASSSEDLGADYHALVIESEKKAFYTRSGVAWGLFIIFWMVGSAIFMQTEGWSYGMSMYFCFIAFTTIGYGDLSPTTPAGRSIFVVWALLGVGTMTILISIVSEAYSSRYKGMLGRGSFDKAVKRYRKRTKVDFNEKAQEVGSASVRFRPQERPSRNEPAALESETSNDGNSAGPTVSDDHHRAHMHAQKSLEALPRHVLNEARSFQQYLRFIGDGSGPEAEEYIDERLRNLLDDVVEGVEGLRESAKVDILRDEDSRRTLFMLSMERSLKELMNVAEQAVAAVNERDRIIASLEQERDEAEACADES
ncbi:hypothetical protein HYDPIDRAFT_29796 [Hydnomerulius pinastri MD-312]|uniref:Potassium channel domain-containing protein n=1 Tax=Hydnomerulius pinastri MD-312 TaxID=994086 RepID=A0A0C9WE74_9AGAM|nr:hypothetical protein HYDPIDRAFT_29796 [Hydnomerulius pinastri MD-312]